MSIRSLAASRGAGWITDGLARLRGRPGPYLQASALVGLLLSFPIVSLLLGLVTPVFYAGLLNLLHRQAGGDTPAVTQAFDGFSQPGAFARLLPIVLLNLAFAVLLVLLLVGLAGSAILTLAKAGASPADSEAVLMALLPSLGRFLLVAIPLGVVFNWITMFAIPQAMLGQVSGLQAMAHGLRAVLANVGALLVNLLCLIVAFVLLMLVLAVPLFVLGLLQQHAPGLALLVQVPVMAAFTGGVLAIYCAMMYQAWSEVFAADAAMSPPPPGTLEA